MYVLVCAVMVAARVIKPDEFQLIMSVRDISLAGRDTDTEASVTIIQNWIGGDSASSDNLPLFLANYGVNAARMLVPVELLTKGMQYIPFLFFQLAVTVYLAGLFVHVDEIEDENQFLALSIFLGYFLASAIFEPDFGSWVRHESATFPVLHLLVMSSNQRVSAWKTNAEVLKSKFHKQAKHSSSWEGEVA